MENAIFDLQEQNEHLESKIVVGLERIAEAFRVLLWQESNTFGLSPIQIQLLIFIHFHTQRQARVSYLAKEFNLTKPTISDAVGSLAQKSLIQKIVDEKDSRSYSIKLTALGKETAQQLATFANPLKKPLLQMNQTEKEQLWQGLLTIMNGLQQSNIISLQRMCFSCTHYQLKQEGHFCALLQKKLQNHEIRIDCPEYFLL